MNPGQSQLCRTCCHFSFESWNAGHPNPCHRNRWIGQKHFTPALASDGRQCEDFQERAKPPDNSSLKPRSEVPSRAESDVKRTPHGGVST